MKWAEIASSEREKRGTYMVLLMKSEGKRPFGRYRRKLASNVVMDLKSSGNGMS
jgi:hypothetical protein